MKNWLYFIVFVLVIFTFVNSCKRQNIAATDSIEQNNQINNSQEKLNPDEGINIPYDIDPIKIQYVVKSGIAYRIIDQREYPIEGIKLKYYYTDNMSYYFIFDNYTVGKYQNEKLGTYFFDHSGKFVRIFPIGETLESTGVYLSPNEKYIGVDSGTWTIRSMTFYSFPDGIEIGHILYKGNIFWNENSVYYTAVSEESNTYKQTDDDYYHYIVGYNLLTGNKTTILNYSPLKEYYLHDLILFGYDTFVLRVDSVDNINEWSDTDKIKESVELLKYNFKQ